MKLSRRILAITLAGWMAFAFAAPDNAAPKEDRPIADKASEPPDPSAVSSSDDAVGDMLLQAISLMGVAYRWGGVNPSTGLDCSGFVQYVFKKSLKLHLPRTAAEQARVGKKVDRADLMPGDLVFFNTLGARYSHVGIYLGNSKFIQAPRTGKSIQISSMKDSYWSSRFTAARRVTRSGGSHVDTDNSIASDTVDDGSTPITERRQAPKQTVCAKGKRGRQCRLDAEKRRKHAATGKARARAKARESAQPRKHKRETRNGKKPLSRPDRKGII